MTRRLIYASLVCAAFAAAHGLLALQIPLRHNANALIDEALFLRLAKNISEQGWLGEYDVLTLVKGVGFPLWLAGVHLSGLNVMLVASLTWSVSCLVLCVALRPVLPSVLGRATIFCLLLSSPAALGDFALMRELIYPAQTLAVVACGAGLCTRLWAGESAWHWAAACGLALAGTVLSREEYIWMAPGVVAIAVAMILCTIYRPMSRKSMVMAASCLLVALVFPMVVVASVNWRAYGVFTLLEFYGGPFTQAYGALTRVKSTDQLPHVPVPRSSWNRIAAVSPAFAEVLAQWSGPQGAPSTGPHVQMAGALIDADPSIRQWLSVNIDYPLPPKQAALSGADLLRKLYESDPDFREGFERFMGGDRSAEAFFSGEMENEIGGAWFVWRLREAVASAGHAHSAVEAAKFYARMADEINAACDKGELECALQRDTLRPRLRRMHLLPILQAIPRIAYATAALPQFSSSTLLGDFGSPQALSHAAAYLHTTVAPSRKEIAATEPVEVAIKFWRVVLPFAALVMILLWAWAHPFRSSRATGGSLSRSSALWWLAGVILALVGARVVLLAVVHATAWPGAASVRYVAAAQPLLMLFVALAIGDFLVRRSSLPKSAPRLSVSA